MNEQAIFDQVSDSEIPNYGLSEGLRFLLEKKEALIELCTKHQLSKLYVFGSALSQKFSDSSDIDFLIQFKDIPFDQYTDHYFELHEDLEALLGKKIDLITDKSLSNTFFIEKLINKRVLLYAA